MRIVFMGTAEFGVPTLRVLHEYHEVAAVVTGGETYRGRGRKLQPSPVKMAARELGVPVFEPGNLSDHGFITNLEEIRADLFFVVAFRILPKVVFTIPPKETVNLHASLLPDYRGAAPINWAIINGDKTTGLTTFYIEESIDTGNIILNTEVSIGPDETAGELAGRMKIISADLSLQTVDLIEKGTVTRITQPLATPRPAPKLSKNDGRINWAKDAQSIHNQVRGMNPSPGAFTEWSQGVLKIHRTEIVDKETPGTPGLIVESSPKEGIIVSCFRGKLRIIEVQLSGKRSMDGPSFVRGYRIKKGSLLHDK